MNEDERRQKLREMKVNRLIDDFGFRASLFAKKQLSSFEIVSGTEAAFRLACQYLYITEDLKRPSELYENEKDIDDWYSRQPSLHHFLTFVGLFGRGKTHLALAIGIWSIERDELAAVYYLVPDLLNQLRQSFEGNAEQSYTKLMAKCKNADVLILDDLGMQKNTDWALEQLDSLIDFRYLNEYQTVFTTNLPADELPPRIASRINEGEVVHLTGCDYRERLGGRRLGQRISK